MAAVARRIARGTALAAGLVLAVSLALSGCGGAASRMAGSAATQAATPATTPSGLLPVFADWRIASLDGLGRLHVITQDGKSDLTGPTLDAGAHNLTISPNGRSIAYLTAPKYGPISLLELGPSSPVVSRFTVPITTSNLTGNAWSPDGSQFAVSGTLNGAPGLYLVDALTGKPTLVPGTGPGDANAFLGSQQPLAGWTDATHAVLAGGSPRTVVVDVTSGHTTLLVLPDPLTIWRIAPDGQQALLMASAGACGSVTPDVAVYDFGTGAIRHLPNITAAMNRQGGGPELWQAGTSLMAGELRTYQPTTVKAALFDIGADTVTPLQPNMIPFAWLPDGQTLLLTSQPPDGGNGAFYTERPVAPDTQPVPLPASITSVVGFVRTAVGPPQGSIAPVVALAHTSVARTIGGSVAQFTARPLALPRCG